jgi:hypothetical protein
MSVPSNILDQALAKAIELGETSAIESDVVRGRIEYICGCLGNRACVRLLMACMLAKIHRPEVDPRNPYTNIGTDDCFSGRTYDEQYITRFIYANRLPCNSTTAFLTPALRNHDSALVTSTELVGRPPQLYRDTLLLLDEVANGRAIADDILAETVRHLIVLRDRRQARIDALAASLKQDDESLPLASEAIVTLLAQHLACKHSSRLPVLIVAAAYQAAADRLGEEVRELKSHLSADEQSGAMGDVEICLVNDDRIVTVYEMKSKRVTRDDVDRALQKVVHHKPRTDNYIFITTDVIDADVREYAAGIYEQTSGSEIAILDCIAFLRHYLHLFHRRRVRFLDAYQDLVLSEPDSAVNQPLKEAFLTLRQAAESDE